MPEPGDLVRFVGSFFVEKGEELRHIMTSVPREGIVLESDSTLIKIMSDEEFCILITEQKKLYKIQKIEELN
jgi:hypothetical protein